MRPWVDVAVERVVGTERALAAAETSIVVVARHST